ncbi:MAG: YigZ family protein [Firmicutes bacterium]|nr:YigZ family protein [Bacillota bacterium]
MLINKSEITIKKSKFIGLLYDVNSLDEVKIILESLKKEHSKARHMPYAYIIGNTAKKTDDKEPHNTAGIQIYNQLIINNLDHHLLVIIRYYGGTKLGAGNLLRTYLSCAKECITPKK